MRIIRRWPVHHHVRAFSGAPAGVGRAHPVAAADHERARAAIDGILDPEAAPDGLDTA